LIFGIIKYSELLKLRKLIIIMKCG